jgi:hypothetical protein
MWKIEIIDKIIYNQLFQSIKLVIYMINYLFIENLLFIKFFDYQLIIYQQ